MQSKTNNGKKNKGTNFHSNNYSLKITKFPNPRQYLLLHSTISQHPRARYLQPKQWSSSKLIIRLDVCFCIQQQFHNIRVPDICSQNKWSSSIIFILRLNVCLSIQQQFHHIHVPVICSQNKWSSFILILSLDVCFGIQQQFHHIHLPQPN